MINKSDLFPIGIGTFGIGGMMERDSSLEDMPQIDALKHSFERGQNYLDMSFLYAEGYANKIIKQALSGINRDDLFINAKLGNVEKVEDVQKQLDEYLNFFGIDYVDSFQIHSPSRIKSVGIEKVSEEIMRLVDKKKTRYFSASNMGPKNLKLAQTGSGDNVFSLENDYSFDVRPCEDVGMLDYCKEKGIMFISYRPIRREGAGLISNLNYPVVTRLAEKYNKTNNQIIVNWYTWKQNVFPIIKSATIKHIDENLEALDFEMSAEDYQQLDSFRVNNPNWNNIDWEYEGTGGTKISGLSFAFDKEQS
jgi:diketogulonate reductase-like aldo/keto reductase